MCLPLLKIFKKVSYSQYTGNSRIIKYYIYIINIIYMKQKNDKMTFRFQNTFENDLIGLTLLSWDPKVNLNFDQNEAT